MKSQTNGAAICAIKSKLTIQNSVFHNCCSLKEGGAVYLYETIADFKNTSFIENNSTNGYSIFSNYSQPIFQACQFTNSFKEEVKGNGNYRAPKAMISIETPPPPQTVVPATPTMTLPDQTPSISPQPTITPQPTVTQILQSNAPEKTKTYTIFIAVICSIIAVVIIIVIVVAIVRKRKARIYPKNDNEEKEPPGISVVIDRIYKEKQVIP